MASASGDDELGHQDDEADEGEDDAEADLHEVAGHVLSGTGADGAADEHAGMDQATTYQTGAAVSAWTSAPGGRRDGQDEHASRHGNAWRIRHRTTSWVVVVSQAGADEPGHEPTDRRQREPRRSPAGIVGERLPVGRFDPRRPAAGVLLAKQRSPRTRRVALLWQRVVVDQGPAEDHQTDAEDPFEYRGRDDVCGQGAGDDGGDRTEQQPLRRLEVDDALVHVRAQAVAHPEHFRQQAGTDGLREGERPTTSMKKGLKNSAPDTPEARATAENSIDAGNIHQWA